MNLYSKFEPDRLTEIDKKIFYGGKFDSSDDREKMAAWQNHRKIRRRALTSMGDEITEDLRRKQLNKLLLIRMNNKKKWIWDFWISMFSIYSSLSCSY